MGVRLSLLFLFLMLLAGCGYQLKGQFQFAEGLSPLVWQADDDADELYQAVRETFALYGLVVRTTPADTLLRIHDIQSGEVSLSDVTLVSLDVEWSLINGYGVTLIDRRQTRSESRLSLSPEVDEDAKRLERQAFLHNRIALRILNQLEALSDAELDQRPGRP
jgi:outer membrane lipopolysaccharide assembly protein LptE/RlpB